MDKEEYFRQLYALNESSDDEQDTNDAREVIKQSAQTPSSSFPVPSQPTSRRSQLSGTSKKVPAIHRTTSAPSPSIIRETPLPVKKPPKKLSKPRYDISSPRELDTAFSNFTPPTTNSTPAPGRSSSTPNLGFQPILAMPNSTGVESMLKRKSTRVDPMLNRTSTGKRKRKEKPVKMMPESEQVFAGKTFFFIPNDDVTSLRKLRIANARSYGAVWVKEWTPEITHIIVEKEYKFEQIMELLKPMMKTDSIPQHIALVNEDYPIDCIQHRTLVDKNQTRYHVKHILTPAEEESQAVQPQAISKNPARKKKDQAAPEERTQRSQPQTQPARPDHVSSSPGAWLPGDSTGHAVLVESPRERSPMQDIDFEDNSELQEMIKLVQSVKDLPLDDDEEEGGEGEDRDYSNDLDPDHEGSSEEEHRPRRARKKKYGKKNEIGSNAYVCMLGGTGDVIENSPNCLTIEILQRLGEYYQRINDVFRSMAYRRAVGMLKRLPIKIATYEQAIDIPGIGDRLAAKIEEIVLTGRLRRLDYVELEPEDLVLQSFIKVYGVSTQIAAKFMQAGYKTLDDLRTKANLTKNQRIGLDHYDDFNTRIPRDEMTALGVIVKVATKLIDPEVEAIIGGSYRRGAATSGDIDFIFTKPGTNCSQDLLPFLYALVDKLTQNGFLTAALATPGHSREDSGSKWHGACVLPGNPIWRRIDFLLVPETELGAALIYFTGDDIFNRSIRLLARHKGCGLNQRGLYKNVLRDSKGNKLSEGELVEGRDEKEIFAFLGVSWRKPEHRICH